MSQKNQNSQTIAKIFASRKIILNQAERRGYNIDNYKNFSINEIMILYSNKQLDMLLTHNESGKKIYYKYHLITKIRPAHVYDYVEDLFNVEEIIDNTDDLVIIGKDKLTDNLRNLIDITFKKEKFYVNILNLNDFQYNILDNNLVPPHRVLTQNEKDDVMREYNILEESQFPNISRFDPVAVIVGVRPGEVVEIIRSSPTSLTTKYYRLCV
jgi:DNA-directed RNA polymerase subunit H